MVIAFLIIVGPIMFLKPSAAQKNATQNRMHAKKLGILLKLVELKAPHFLPNAPKMAMQYYLLRPNSENFAHQIKEEEFWQIADKKWVDKISYPCAPNWANELNKLPSFVYKFVSNEQIVALYLSDGVAPCTNDCIEQIAQFLQQKI